jgi:integrase
MSVYKRDGSPYWSYDFTVRGVRFRGSTEVADKGTAETIAGNKRTEIVLGQHFPKKRSPISVGVAFARYFKEKAEGRSSENDVFRMLDRLAQFLGDNTLLASIDSDRLSELVALRRSDTVRTGTDDTGRPILRLVANATVNRDIELLRRVWRRAKIAWKRDIGEDIDWGELLLEEPAERERSLSHEEKQRLLAAAAATAPDLVPAIRFALMIGVRLSNVINLAWSQVRLAGKAPDVTFRVKSRKPGGEILRLPLPRDTVLLLASLSGQHETHVFTYAVSKKRGARQKGTRKPFTKTGLHKVWKKVLASAKIDDFRWHDLRHTAGTWTLRKTKNLALVKKMLGHKRIESTMRYAHVLDEDLREGMEAVAGEFRADSVTEYATDTAKPQETQTKKQTG